MQLTSAPSKLTLPFANAGGKNTIPVASQIGITAGAASYTDGFPPQTRTPIASGGVPPSGLDMNGILNPITAAIRWWSAGAGFVYDSTFANDTNIGGYPIGARVLRTDGTGYWLNTTDNNTTDPESTGSAAAGWVPEFTNGTVAITMTNANVTLTAPQYGKRIIAISGTLTANLNLVFPTIPTRWLVINNTTGAYAITCKTASGTGVALTTGVSAEIYGDGVNINYATVTMSQVQNQTGTAFTTAGAAPNFTLTPTPAIAFNAAVRLRVSFNAAGTTGSNTLNVSGTGAKNVMQYDSNGTLVPAVIPNGLLSDVESNGSVWVLLDPVAGKTSVVGSIRNAKMSVAAASASATFTADEIVVETALGGVAYQLASFSQTINLATTGAGGMDTGTAPVSGYVALYAIYNPTTNARNILATNAATLQGNVYGGANMPSGYTASALIGVWPTNASSQFVIGVQYDRKFWGPYTSVLSSSSVVTNQSLSISAAVPVNAKSCSGAASLGNSAASQMQFQIKGDTNTTGQQLLAIGITSTYAVNGSMAFDVPIITAQTIYYTTTSSAGTPTYNMSISSYTF